MQPVDEFYFAVLLKYLDLTGTVVVSRISMEMIEKCKMYLGYHDNSIATLSP